jgi:hypothetical protein
VASDSAGSRCGEPGSEAIVICVGTGGRSVVECSSPRAILAAIAADRGMVEWLWVVALGGIGGLSDVAARFRRKQAKARGMISR